MNLLYVPYFCLFFLGQDSFANNIPQYDYVEVIRDVVNRVDEAIECSSKQSVGQSSSEQHRAEQTEDDKKFKSEITETKS